MKKSLSILAASVLLTLGISFAALAASASASLTGPGTVRAGDTISVSFKMNGSGLSGASGTLSYNTSQLSLTSTKQKIAAPWAVEFNGSNFVAYDNNLTNPIKSNKELFIATFKVKSVAVGTKITVSYTNVVASDGKTDSNIGTVSYSATIAAPLSTNTNLGSLAVSNATISPAFGKGTTSYTAEVPFDVSKLNVSAAAEDSLSKVSISNPGLTPGGTTNVTVTVTAQSGAKKSYTIKVKRAQDPNYKASANSNLSGIKVDGFLLSPGFKPDVTSYMVWLPYETTSVKVSGTAADAKAQGVEISGRQNLMAGQDNTVKITCTAENGDKREYTLIVKRAAAHDGSVDGKPTETTTASTTLSTSTEPSVVDASGDPSGSPAWLTILLVIIGLAAGFAGGFFMRDKLKQ